MNVEIEAEAALIPEKEYISGIFVVVWSRSGLKLVCNVNIACRNLKSENSPDYAPKPQRSCSFMNSASGSLE